MFSCLFPLRIHVVCNGLDHAVASVMVHFVDVGVCGFQGRYRVVAGEAVVVQALFVGVEFIGGGEGFGFSGKIRDGCGGRNSTGTRVRVR